MAKVAVLSIFSEFRQNVFSSSVKVADPVGVSVAEEKFITLEEVSWHDNSSDCWIIIYDRVYDITDFLDEHPGGGEILLEFAGREASGAFRGSGHSTDAIKLLEKYYIGELPIHERIFRKPGGLRLSDMPV